jgi:hypothetical protein
MIRTFLKNSVTHRQSTIVYDSVTHNTHKIRFLSSCNNKNHLFLPSLLSSFVACFLFLYFSFFLVCLNMLPAAGTIQCRTVCSLMHNKSQGTWKIVFAVLFKVLAFALSQALCQTMNSGCSGFQCGFVHVHTSIYVYKAQLYIYCLCIHTLCIHNRKKRLCLGYKPQVLIMQ